MAICRFCLQPIPVERKINRTAVCPSCGQDVHCCRNCRFHDRAAHNECLEPQAEWTAIKEKANFCDYFEVAADSPERVGAPDPGARKRLEELFKKE